MHIPLQIVLADKTDEYIKLVNKQGKLQSEVNDLEDQFYKTSKEIHSMFKVDTSYKKYSRQRIDLYNEKLWTEVLAMQQLVGNLVDVTGEIKTKKQQITNNQVLIDKLYTVTSE